MSLRAVFHKQHALFVPFIMAGYPDINTTVNLIHGLAENGADIIELGVPFSDPMADGPINQQAAEVALKNGMTLDLCLSIVNTVREEGCMTPIILFSYLNPILKMNVKKFAQKAKSSGVNGVLMVDLPVEEAASINDILVHAGLEMIVLVSPTTSQQRLTKINDLKPGFIYYISRFGVTGVQQALAQGLKEQVVQIKSVLTDIPICVGFGISTPEQAAVVSQFSDGVIVGSALVNLLSKVNMIDFFSVVRQFSTSIKCHAQLNRLLTK